MVDDDSSRSSSSHELGRRNVLGTGAGLGAASLLPATVAGENGRSENAPETPGSPSGTGARFYVSPDGDDDWNGKVPDRRGKGKAGPFATLERARDAIRDLKGEEGLPEGGVTVFLRGGTYRRISTSFELTAEDSGTEDAPIVYEAYEDEDVRLVGGAELDSDEFEPVSDPDVRERLPESSREEVVQYDLAAHGITDYGEIVTTGLNLPRSPANPEVFVNGESMTLARWPNDRWTWVGEPVVDPGARPRDIQEHFTTRPLPDAFDDGATFTYFEKRPETWASVEDVWMNGYWWNDYATSNLAIESIDEDAGTITTEQAHLYSVRAWQRYYYYNVLDELDVPGEYYLDRDTGMLYLYSPAPIEESTVRISLLADPVVSIEGAEHVTFRDVTVEISRGTGVQMIDCSHCRVESSTIRRVGLLGVNVGDNPAERTGGNDGGTNNGVVDCEIYDTGQGAVKLGGGDRETLTPGNNYAVSNDLHDYSRVRRTYTPAVWPTGVGNVIACNHMHHAPHQAILIGGNEHEIKYNDIHHVVQETGDAGAIYMGRDWSEHGNRIRYNFLHHIDSEVGGPYGIGQVGVYLDDLQSGTDIVGNVFYDVHTAMSIGGGRHNRIHNNLIVDCLNSIDLDARGLDEEWPHCKEGGVMRDRLRAMPYKQEPWRSRYPKLVTLLDDVPCAPKYNSITCNVSIDSTNFSIADAARRTGTVANNLELAFEPDLEVDPEFTAGSEWDFTFDSDSAVLDALPCYENVPFDRMATDWTGPDYTIGDLGATRVADGRHEVTVTVDNQGREAAPATTVRVEDAATGETIGEADVDSVPAYESAETTVTWDTSGIEDGTERGIRAVVDPADEVAELSESNNTATATVAIPAWPVDLAVTPVYGRVTADDTVALTVSVENLGTAASESTALELRDVTGAEPTTLATMEVSALEAGASEQFHHEWDVSDLESDGTRQVEAAVNPAGDLPEASEENNTSATTTIRPFEPLPEAYEAYASTTAVFGTQDGHLAISANGTDIWEESDEYGVVYRPDERADADTVATVKVLTQQSPDGWAKAGLMLRNDVTGAGESGGYAAFMVTPENGFEFEWDDIGTGYVNSAANAGETSYPVWLRLARDGTTVTASYSTDGESWTEVASEPIFGVAGEQDIGVFSTSHDSQQGLATFDEFEVS